MDVSREVYYIHFHVFNNKRPASILFVYEACVMYYIDIDKTVNKPSIIKCSFIEDENSVLILEDIYCWNWKAHTS